MKQFILNKWFGFILLLGSLLIVTGTLFAANGAVSTNVTTDSGCEGIFFDLTAGSETVTITGFEHNVVGNATVQIFYKPGTFQGSETNAGAWTLLGAQAVTGGVGFSQTLTPVNVGGLVIPPNQTFGILIYTGYSGDGINPATLATRYDYDNNNSRSFSDGSLSVYSGSASCSISFSDPPPFNDNNPFNGVIANRVWHGTVFYTTGATAVSFLDGRINRFDMAAPFGVYPHSVNAEIGLAIYDAYVGRGESRELLIVSAAQIAAVPEFPEVNTLIAASRDGRVSVYRLTDGTFQVQGPTYNGKEYILQFAEIRSQVPYTSYETN